MAWTSKAHRAAATADRMRAAGEKAALRRAKVGQLVKALHASTFQRDWARVNTKHQAAFWKGGRRTSIRDASGQAGSKVEMRQAEAQRAHAAEAWAEHELDDAQEGRRDRAPAGSEGDARPYAACTDRDRAGDRAPPPGLRPAWRPPGTNISSGYLGASLIGGRCPACQFGSKASRSGLRQRGSR